MTDKEKNEAWEKCLAEKNVKAALAGRKDQLEVWLKWAFLSGIEAAEAPWRDPIVSAERLKQI